ncbi:bacteriohemerythrin [Thalassolituus marinus]|uniref:Bacteriohemerythrin n=1 Tax=Thalassolituus marinus TaxID=671053 RepID=A0ABS7ZTA5_9GAMM|nr:bacteriohemerythrin [Thalassolituus marinus]MCA6063780.1 bacteriohemerythrin [Thalassolituus marinus]
MIDQDVRTAFDIVSWNRSLETGIDIIDQQHRQLVKLLNDLAHQYVYGLEPDQLKEIVDGLVDYAAYHFETEEGLWVEAFEGDEWFTRHHRSHDGFVGKVRSMQARIEQSPSLAGVDDLLSFLVSWLAHHILHDDRSMAVALLEVRKGHSLPEAKATSHESMSGQASGLIQSVLSMYKQLSGRTLALQREAYARELAEKKLREQEDHWKSVLGATNDSLWDWNLEVLDTGDPDATARLFAHVGQSVHPEDWPALKEDFLAHLLGKTEVFSHQYRVLENDGGERWVQSRGKVIAHDADGRPSRIVGTQTDITERRTQELILQRERDTRLLISDFASDLMAASPEEFDGAIERALQRAGAYMGADRTYVFLVNEDPRYMSNTHEWCAAGISPEIDNLQNIPSNLTPWWWQQLRTTGHVLVPRVSDLPPAAHAEHAILEAQDIQSVCVYPLHMHGELVGFLGNDAVREERHWGAETLQFLELMSDLLSIALEHRQVQKQREQAASRLERAEQQAHLGHWSYKLDSGEAYWSPEVFRIFERNPEDSTPTYDTYLDMVHPEDRQKTHEAFQQAKNEAVYLHAEHRVCLAPGQIKYLEVRGQFETGPDGKPALVEGTIQDISEKPRHREQLRRLAYEDALTGLPNRRAVEDRLRRELDQCEQRRSRLVLALLDLDNFREANERHGPALGDDVLVALSQRMRTVCDDPAVVGRIGGDEFVILVPRMSPDDDNFLMFRRLLVAINEPLVMSGVEVRITASIGVTQYPQLENVSEEQLLRQAQQALFQAKMQGKNRLEQYDVQWEQSTRALTGKLQAIQQALLNEEFILYYQPKVNMAKGTVLGAEALIRWQKPGGDIVPPGAFLPAIQDHPLEIELGDWVIRTALAQAEAWHEQGLSLEVSVNVTSLQILEDSFISKLQAALDAHPGIAPEVLQIEILESSALHDLDKVSRVMQACRKLGVRFALDDFGTGFSSLSYLKHLPANVLKIDQSFVRNMLDDSDDLSIISGVVGMSQAFGLQVLAEGIETEQHGDLLLRLGCELGQGYGIARPMRAEDLPEWVRHWQASHAWREVKPVDFHNLPLLHAEVEHRHWVNQLEQWLRGDIESLPVLESTQCKVGRWIENNGWNRFRDNPVFTQLVADHERLHHLGEKVVDARARSDEAKVHEMLSNAYEYRDRVLEALKRLEQTTDK